MTSFSDMSANNNNNNKYSAMVSQLYTFTTWSRPKSFGHGGLPYVGFPGLTLTPIPENPLLDSMLEEDGLDSHKPELWPQEDIMDNQWSPSAMTKGSLPNHWITNGTDAVSPMIAEENVDSSKDSDSSSNSKSCSVTVSSKEAFFHKDEDGLTREQKRSHLCKLLLFALVGFVVVAGIVLWIFSPAFT